MYKVQYQSCVSACSDCIVESLHCATLDLGEQSVKMSARCIKLNYECASICTLLMHAMASNSEFIQKIARLCIEICNASAEECEKHSKMDHCVLCAEKCRDCAEKLAPGQIQCGRQRTQRAHRNGFLCDPCVLSRPSRFPKTCRLNLGTSNGKL